MLHIRVVADTNDGDYITNLQKFDRSELPLILKVVAAIKDFDSRTTRGSGQSNWPSSYYRKDSPRAVYEGVLTEDEIEAFEDYVPCGEDGVHTIETVEIFEIINREVLL
jgi:hypothetical protein